MPHPEAFPAPMRDGRYKRLDVRTWSQLGGAFSAGSAVVGMAVTPDDGGYWIVNDLGEIAACGDAVYFGQPGALNKPVVGIAATPDGGGYYEVASDGGIFAFGNAHFQRSTVNQTQSRPSAPHRIRSGCTNGRQCFNTATVKEF